MSVDEKITQVYEAHRKRLMEWMIENGFRSSAGDETFDELLSELAWKINRLREEKDLDALSDPNPYDKIL